LEVLPEMINPAMTRTMHTRFCRHWNCRFQRSGFHALLYKEDLMKTGPVFRHKIALNKTGRKRSRDIFSNTIQKTDVWLNDLMSELDWEDRPHKTYMALRTVLRALRDRLPVEEGIQLGAQLPMLIRGFYYESWNLKDKPHKERCKEDFLDDVKKAFKND